MNLFCCRCVEVYQSDTLLTNCKICGLGSTVLGVVHKSWVEYVKEPDDEYRRELLYIQNIRDGELTNYWGSILCFLNDNRLSITHTGTMADAESKTRFIQNGLPKLDEINPDILSDEYLIKQMK